MAEDRFERVTNLVTYLLNRPRGATFAEILSEIPGWPDGVDARRRAFERDKRVLRDEGIPLHEEGGRYRIPPEEYYLPDLDLTEDEQIALRVAVAAVSIGRESAGLALHKLTLGGGAGVALEEAIPAVAALEEHPRLPTLHAATRDRSLVRFSYNDTRREVEPWRLLFRDGYWYLTGLDRTRGDDRTFRVDRIHGEIDVTAPGAFAARPRTVPAMPTQPWLLAYDDEPEIEAVVDVDAVMAAKAVADIGTQGDAVWGDDGSVRIRFPVQNREKLRSWILGMLDHAVIVEPKDLRDDIVAWLEAIVAAG